MRFRDYARASRSRTLARPTAATATILAAARALLAAAMPEIERRGITLLGLTLLNLEDDDEQLALPLDGAESAALDEAVDDVRDRFGTGAVTRAAVLDLNDRPEAPAEFHRRPGRDR